MLGDVHSLLILNRPRMCVQYHNIYYCKHFTWEIDIFCTVCLQLVVHRVCVCLNKLGVVHFWMTVNRGWICLVPFNFG